MHYQLTPSDVERFWTHVHKTESCWLWNNDPSRHGVFHLPDHLHRSVSAHRVAYVLAHGAIPDGYLVCHHCDVPGCVRSDHLFAATNRGNMLDCSTKGRTLVGSTNGNARLTWEAVRLIRASYAPDPAKAPCRQRGAGTIRALARQFGVSQTTIRHIVTEQTWPPSRDPQRATRQALECSMLLPYRIVLSPDRSGEGYAIDVRVPKGLHRDLVRYADADGLSLTAFVNSALARAVGPREDT